MSLGVVRNRTLFKSADAPVSVQRWSKKKAKQDKLEDAYAVVNIRDGNKCRITGKPLDAASLDPAHRREHHHLTGRRVRPDWRERPERIILVSKLAHDCITQGWLVIQGTDGRKPIFAHWASHVKPTQRPFQIRRHNKVVNE